MSSLKAVIYMVGNHKRARIIADAMRMGFKRTGVDHVVRQRFTGVEGDFAVAYGWNHEAVFKHYGKYIYFDLGYWDRKPKGQPKEGLHRMSINSWSPVDTMVYDRPGDRLEATFQGLELRNSKGREILIAGMSAKAANVYGFNYYQWETEFEKTIRPFTKRVIVQRPKPTKTVPGIPVQEALQRSSLVASYHSNIAVEAMIEGVAVYTERGIGTLVSIKDLREIDTARPPMEDERLAFLRNIAYCQWAPSEMRTGEVWNHAKDRLLR